MDAAPTSNGAPDGAPPTMPRARSEQLSPRNVAASARQIRVARPTSRLAEVVAFYRDALGLDLIDAFKNHNGYTGAMLGLPGSELHLEFTTQEVDCAREVGRAPTDDNLLVFYVDDEAEFAAIVRQFRESGLLPVPPANPYWMTVGGQTYLDPDGWRIVIVPGSYEA